MPVLIYNDKLFNTSVFIEHMRLATQNLKEDSVDPESAADTSDDVAWAVSDFFLGVSDFTHRPLRLSSVGQLCEKKFLYEAHNVTPLEEASAEFKLKMLSGNIFESIILQLMEKAGYSITEKQAEVSLEGVKGHVDGVLQLSDNRRVVFDIKTGHQFTLNKILNGTLVDNDSFGYLTQLGSYAFAMREHDPNVLPLGIFITYDKAFSTFGAAVYDFSEDEEYFRNRIRDRKNLYKESSPEALNDTTRPFSDEPKGKSGNRVLPTVCRYCNFKENCWSTLEKVDYSSGPVFFTHIEKEPNVLGNKVKGL